MKKFIAIFGILSLFAVSSVAYAQENVVFVLLTSEPKATVSVDGNDSVTIYQDETIAFTRKVVSIGMESFNYQWNWNNDILDCSESTEPDDTDLICTAVGVGSTDVKYTAYATMNDQTEITAESEIITVIVSDDLPAVSDYFGHQNSTAIKYLFDNGIVEGYPDGTFKPDNNLTRAELMKILVLGAGFNPIEEEYNNCFPDVKDEWFAKYVCFGEANGFVEGYPDGTFKPGENVLKVEAVKMLLEIFYMNIIDNLDTFYNDVDEGAWYFNYIMTAYNLGLLEEEAGTDYNPGAAITRGQVSENIYRLLMYEQERFDYANAQMICDIEAAGEQVFTEMTLEELEPLLIEKLEEQGFNLDYEGAFDAITSRYSYSLNTYLNNPELFCI